MHGAAERQLSQPVPSHYENIHLLFKFKLQKLFLVLWYRLGPQLRAELALFKPERFLIQLKK